MKISEIYEKYNIMPLLQVHMYRVASVAKIICDGSLVEVNEKEIISACLLHDMGNIIKFKLGFIPESIEPKGLEYWQKIKDEFIQKYGNDEHIATVAISQEIGVSEQVLSIIKAIGFSKAKAGFESGRADIGICIYADTRIVPSGILSLLDAANEGLARHRANRNINENDMEFFNQCLEHLQKIENNIFIKCRIKASDITLDKVTQTIAILKDYEIN